jgi:hypothetical protein
MGNKGVAKRDSCLMKLPDGHSLKTGKQQLHCCQPKEKGLAFSEPSRCGAS